MERMARWSAQSQRSRLERVRRSDDDARAHRQYDGADLCAGERTPQTGVTGGGRTARPGTESAVNTMYDEREVMVAFLYVQERQEQAARERLLRELRSQEREGNALVARLGRTLIRTGRRLEAFGTTGTWEQAKVA